MTIEYIGSLGIYLSEIIKKERPDKIFIVKGRSSYVNSGAKAVVDQTLEGIECIEFNAFSSNPKFEDINNGVSVFEKERPDLILAIGGGSSIDVAKLINVWANNKKSDEIDTISNFNLLKNVPFVSVPTTAGSGSEATQFAVCYDKGVKQSIDNSCLLPDYVVLDSVLTQAKSKHLIAVTGFDALSQAVESFWSVNSTDHSQKYSRKAITLILECLIPSLLGSEEAKENMLIASNFAGKAINITRTTAPHAISYSLTSRFGIPHGHAVALTLGKIASLNYHSESINDPRGRKYISQTMLSVFELFSAKDADGFMRAWYTLMAKAELEIALEDIVSVTLDDINYIVENVNFSRLNNNPVKLNEEDIRSVFSQGPSDV